MSLAQGLVDLFSQILRHLWTPQYLLLSLLAISYRSQPTPLLWFGEGLQEQNNQNLIKYSIYVKIILDIIYVWKSTYVSTRTCFQKSKVTNSLASNIHLPLILEIHSYTIVIFLYLFAQPGACVCSVCTILLLHTKSPSGTNSGPVVHHKQDIDLYIGTTGTVCIFMFTFLQPDLFFSRFFSLSCHLISLKTVFFFFP